MATGNHQSIAVEKAEVSSSSRQAAETQPDPRQIQPPSKTTISSTGAGTPFLNGSTYKVDAEKSAIESELQISPLAFIGYSHTSTKVPKRRHSSPDSNLQLGCQLVQARLLLHNRVPSELKPSEILGNKAA